MKLYTRALLIHYHTVGIWNLEAACVFNCISQIHYTHGRLNESLAYGTWTVEHYFKCYTPALAIDLVRGLLQLGQTLSNLDDMCVCLEQLWRFAVCFHTFVQSFGFGLCSAGTAHSLCGLQVLDFQIYSDDSDCDAVFGYTPMTAIVTLSLDILR
jgi:hypothetical protein